MKVLALAGYDSFLNTARLIAPYFEAKGANVEFALVKARKKKQISSEQITEMGIPTPVQHVDIKNFCHSGDILKYDIVLSCLEGLSTRRLFHYLPQNSNQRPYVITVYPGLILRYGYDGFSVRAPADQIWLNCERDLKSYSAMCEAFELDGSNARLFGNASLLEVINRNQTAAMKGPIVFFEQAVIPRYFLERTYLVDRLCELALRNPERQVLVKARAAGKKETLHRAWHPIEKLFEKKKKKDGGLPGNISLTEEKVPSLLRRASHCLTISSTVAVEAISAKVPTTIITDFGAHDDYGLHYFYGSGLCANFSSVDVNVTREPRAEWLKSAMFDPRFSIEELVQEVLQKSQNKIFVKTNKATEASKLREFLLSEGEDSYISRKYEKKGINFSNLISKIRINKFGKKV